MDVPRGKTRRTETRIPFYAPVVASGLRRCWATNLSRRGVGLSALVDESKPPGQGDILELELTLGRAKRLLEVRGRVAWRSLERLDGRIGLGVEFCALEPSDRSVLARFVEDHRPRVLAALPSAEDRRILDAAFDDDNVDIVDGETSLSLERLRSSAALLLFGADVQTLHGFLDALWRLRTESGAAPGDPPLPPVIVCTPVDSDLLQPLVTEHRIYEVLRPPWDPTTLSLAAQRSTEYWALQVELGWTSLQLDAAAVGPKRRHSLRSHDSAATRPTIIREDESMMRTYELLETGAVHDVPVLLLGETGTGKELAAREVHALSRRADTPFVALDCGALTETLLESELFGHVRGAFTGATSDHLGLFRIADGGTIFLDEIQNTTPALQAKLLRVVEEGEVRPVGSTKVHRVDVRLIAACNRDLRREVDEQRFRADFYYRLNRFPIHLPPLRDRPGCMPALARRFVEVLSEELGRPCCELAEGFEATLLAYHWPGNVRELKNAVERAILLTPVGEPLRPAALPEEVQLAAGDPARGQIGLDAQIDDFARRVIRRALERNSGVIRRAAAELTINPVTLARRMRKLGLG